MSQKRRVGLNILLVVVLFSLGGGFFIAPLSAQDTRPAASSKLYEVILLGNTGAGTSDDLLPTLDLLRQQLSAAGEDVAVVFLGDQVPCCGMPEQGEPGRAEAEARLTMLAESVRESKGELYFIPGDQDYAEGDQRLASLSRQVAFLEEQLQREDIFLPKKGLPGPIDVKLADDVYLVVLNTDWVLQPSPTATGEVEDYEIEETNDFYMALEEVITKRIGDNTIIVGHHPIYSNGQYGGHRPPYYLVPALGTLAYAIQRFRGDEQYVAHTRNEWMRHRVEALLEEHDDFVFVSAHDYSLQHFKDEKIHLMKDYVVSGSAAQSKYVTVNHAPKGYDTNLASKAKGFVSLHFYRDGSAWLEAWTARPDGSGQLLYETRLKNRELPVEDHAMAAATVEDTDYTGRVAEVIPEPGYKAGWFRKAMLGSNHRKAWTTPVQAPYFDLKQTAGTLVPVKRGGGAQTTSIRLEAEDGKQYALRSINKDGRRILPIVWQQTFLAPIVQDGLSYAHPYGAFAVPKMAEAVGVYHTNPKLVYMPSDPRLGVFQNLVGDTLMLFEERPNDDMSDASSFGNSSEVIGWTDLFRKVTNDNDHQADAHALVRARLFDMWLSDWDRHKDQWRWSTFKDPDGEGDIHRPIPRDRDQAFNRLNPIIAPIVKPYAPLQDYRKSYGNLKGLGTQARHQDHRFLSRLSRNDWLALADSIQTALTDEVIVAGIRDLPQSIYDLHGEELIEVGKVRRAKLPDVAERVYRLHARSVDVVGSHKHERFEVTRRNKDEVEVVVYKTSKEGELRGEIYRRVLHRNETREINLYGLGGIDQFIISGDVPHSIRVNAVGGPGPDTFVDESQVGGLGKKTHFYDTTHDGNTFQESRETKVKRSEDPKYNEYTGFFEFNRHIPFIGPLYNSDDGLVVLGGVIFKNHAFQKAPYARRHRFLLSYATKTKAVQAKYHGTFSEVIGDWDLHLNLEYYDPNNIRNFFGLGNETENREGDIRIAQTRVEALYFDLPFQQDFEMGAMVEVAPTMTMVNLNNADSLLLGLSQPGLAPLQLAPEWFVGGVARINLHYIDEPDNPWRGYQWNTDVAVNVGVQNAPEDFAQISSALALYYSPTTRRQYTLAVRVGGAHTFGTFPYYASNALGGKTNLRGYRSTRFSGRSSFFLNSELRLEVFNIRKTLFPGRIGLLGFVDTGRVWTDGESSTTWHQGIGGGIWYNIANEILVNFTYSWSEEDTFMLFGVGFFF